MSLPQFIVHEHLAGLKGRIGVTLELGEFHHIYVRRITAGEHIALLGDDGIVLEVVFKALEDNLLVADVVGEQMQPSTPKLVLYQGISKGERMETVIRAATELGVFRIVPLMSARCIVQLKESSRASSKVERWNRIARESVKQSGRCSIPEVSLPCNMQDAIDETADRGACIICPWEEQYSGSIKAVLDAVKPCEVALFIGPEGGFSASEADAVREAGGHLVSLGPAILRTETAGIVASAIVLHELGGLGNEGR